MLNIDYSKIPDLFIYHKDEPLIFSSGLFLVIFTVFMSIYAFLYKNHRAKTTFVTLFSLYFYYKSSGIYFILLLTSTIVDYALADWIYKAKKDTSKKAVLILSLILNLGLLVYFKYTNFFAEIVSNLSGGKFEPMDIFLPVGVSFFTFQSLSYTIDIYRGTLKPVKNILDYAFFVTFFPQLVAGPIVRAVDFIPQIFKPVIVTKEMIGKAVFLISSGLIKKAIIADYISINFVDRIFDNPLLYSGFENLVGVYGYALQIYCDFSGYSDMAIGIALLMGFHFNINFDSSYKSKNITEFWRRWHISLSTWLKDYLYISMGGNRKGKIRTYFNLFITMVLGGLWHGAGMRFILWGALHGLALVFHKLFQTLFPKKENTNFFITFLSWILTFHFVCFCWIFFRADNMKIANEVLYQIFNNFNLNIFFDFIKGYNYVLILIVFGYILHFTPKTIETKTEKLFINSSLLTKSIFVVIVIFVLVQFKSSEIQPFIYFQF
jgi:D-alanyl-lipoteichoic acid acyltransferase DltB (MBOAT superfamily)